MTINTDSRQEQRHAVEWPADERQLIVLQSVSAYLHRNADVERGVDVGTPVEKASPDMFPDKRQRR